MAGKRKDDTSYGTAETAVQDATEHVDRTPKEKLETATKALADVALNYAVDGPGRGMNYPDPKDEWQKIGNILEALAENKVQVNEKQMDAIDWLGARGEAPEGLPGYDDDFPLAQNNTYPRGTAREYGHIIEAVIDSGIIKGDLLEELKNARQELGALQGGASTMMAAADQQRERDREMLRERRPAETADAAA